MLTTALAGLARPAAAETLREVLSTALADSPALRSQRAQFDALGESQVQARAQFGPTMQIGANSTASSNINQPDDTAVALSLNQPVFASGRIAANARATKADVEAGRERLRQVEVNLVAAVARAYADVRRDEAALALADDFLRLIEAYGQEVQARIAAGQITRTDLDQTLSRQAEARGSRAVALGQLEVSRAAYAALVGGRPGTLAGLPQVRGFANLEAATAAAEARNPQLSAARFDQQGTRARVAGARSEFGPTVSLRGNMGYQQVWQAQRQEAVRADTLSVVVNQPLFTSGLTRSRVRQAQDRNTAAENLVQDARRSAVRDVEQAWAGAIAAHARLTTGAERVERARMAQDGVQIEYRVGLRTTLEVLNAAQERNGAAMALAAAERDAFAADVALLQATGTLEPESFSEAPAPTPVAMVAPTALPALTSLLVRTPAPTANAPTASPPPVTAPPVASTMPAPAAAPSPAPPAPAPAAPAPTVAAADPAPSARGFAVQTGAYDSAEAAQAGLDRLVASHAGLAGRPQAIQTALVKGRRFYRALFVGFPGRAEAADACAAMGVACFVRAAPGGGAD